MEDGAALQDGAAMSNEDFEGIEEPDLSFDDWSGMSYVPGATGRPPGRPRKPEHELSRQARHMRKERAAAAPMTIVRPGKDPRKQRADDAKDTLKYARGQDVIDIRAWIATGHVNKLQV